MCIVLVYSYGKCHLDETIWYDNIHDEVALTLLLILNGNNFDTPVDYIINIQIIKEATNDAIVKEILHETKLHREIDYSNVMINFFGIIKIIQTKNIICNKGYAS
ncbi:uncharacterized protein OCT59_006949 [Rhizophagus irregularis]|uniref:uncharacterized protein n=1 Tax=Rhizophagus irregularis TaxID=588596 RepID=UPI00332F4C97|nr:hypothetical protein OCT59_006949 [Rhizophagus irregularis]